MLDQLIKQDFVRAWYQSTLFAPFLDGFVEELVGQGFEAAELRRKLCAVTWFAEHLRRQGVQAIAAITPNHIDEFVAAKSGGRVQSPRAAEHRRAAKDLLKHLERRGEWTSPPKQELTGPLGDFFCSLVHERGLQPASIRNYRHYANRFLRHVGCDGARESLARLMAGDVDRFIVEVGHSYSRRSMGSFCASIRGLLRYLYRTGILVSDLSLAVLTPRYYALERLPCALRWEDVQRILSAVDATTPRGRRDLAMLWLLVTYGLRAGEVEQLRLDDIDWRRELIRVHRSKPGRPLNLPLTREVGDAVLAYLQDGRPKTTCREIFIRVKAPHTPLRHHIGAVVTHYMRKADIESRHGGAYVIRHSFAVHLLRQGKPLKTITDLLGHANPRTAFHYTKLALEDLRDVALPTTEVLP